MSLFTLKNDKLLSNENITDVLIPNDSHFLCDLYFSEMLNGIKINYIKISFTVNEKIFYIPDFYNKYDNYINTINIYINIEEFEETTLNFQYSNDGNTWNELVSITNGIISDCVEGINIHVFPVAKKENDVKQIIGVSKVISLTHDSSVSQARNVLKEISYENIYSNLNFSGIVVSNMSMSMINMSPINVIHSKSVSHHLQQSELSTTKQLKVLNIKSNISIPNDIMNSSDNNINNGNGNLKYINLTLQVGSYFELDCNFGENRHISSVDGLPSGINLVGEVLSGTPKNDGVTNFVITFTSGEKLKGRIEVEPVNHIL